MKTVTLAAIGAAIALGGTSDSQAATYTFAAANCSIHLNAWCVDGSQMTRFKAGLLDNANFGAGGIVDTDIDIVFKTDFSDMSGIDGFISGYWLDSQAAPYVSQITSFFLGGGDLFLLNDSASYDPIGQALGIPTVGSSNGSASNGSGPLFDGPFGTAVNVGQSGTVGHISATAVTANGGTVAGVNNAGQVTAAYWSDGDYASGAGRMVIAGDVDMISNFGGATYGPTNDRGRFGLNSVAFLIGGNAGGVPEPATWAMLVIGFGAIGAGVRSKRRCTAVSFV